MSACFLPGFSLWVRFFVRSELRHDDFVLESSRGDQQQERSHCEKSQRIGPQMDNRGAAQDHPAGNIDKISRRNQIAQREEKLGHGFQRENVTGEKDTWQNRQKRQLHGFRLRVGLAGNQNSQRQRNKNVRQRQDGQQDYVAVNRHAKCEAHERQNHAQFKKSDAQIWQQFAQQQSHRPNRRDEQLFQRPTLFFPHDRKCRQERGHIQQQNRRKSRQKKIRRTRIRVEQQ